MERIRNLKLSPATVIAVVALFVALGGTAIAAIHVGSRAINDGSVRLIDLHSNSVDSSKVIDGSLTKSDLNLSTINYLPDRVRYVFDEAADNPGTQPAGISSQIDVSCGTNERAIGGSGAWIIPNFQDNDQPTALQDVYISASMPIPARPGTDFATGWRVTGRNVTGTVRRLRGYAICVPRQP